MIVNLTVIFLILFIGYFFYQRSVLIKTASNTYRKRYIVIISIILILQSGLRHVAVGEDTYTYYLGFKDIALMSWANVEQSFWEYFRFSVGKDPGFLIFQKLFQILTVDFQWFLLFIAVLFFISFGVFLYKNTSSISDCIIAYVVYSVMFYTFYSYTGLRQTIAMSTILLSYELIKKRKLLSFIICILLASLIHKSALIFFLFYVLTYIRSTKVMIWLTLISFPVLLFFSGKIAYYFITITGSYSDYESTEKYRPVTFVALMIVLALFAAFNHDTIVQKERTKKFYYVAFSMAIFFMAFVFEIHGYMRVVQYFSFFMVLLIPEIINSAERFSKKFKYGLSILTVSVLIGLFIKVNVSQEIKYAFYWEEMRLANHYFISD